MCHNSKTDAEGIDGKEMWSWETEDIKSSMKLALQGLAINRLGTHSKDPGAKRAQSVLGDLLVRS
jgi:hypothetical protein